MVAQRAGKLFPRGAIAMQLGVILLLCAAVVPNAALTSADVEWYTTEIVNIIEDDRDLLPKFVRLSFHDCVGVGGCNGCVDMGNVDNAGLNIPIDALEAIFTSESNNSPSASISRADLWALAGLVSAHRAAELAQGTVPDFTFRYGRTDCATSPDGDGSDVLPSASSLGTDEVFAFFDDKFGFTQEDTVALMGAHTLGRCSKVRAGRLFRVSSITCSSAFLNLQTRVNTNRTAKITVQFRTFLESSIIKVLAYPRIATLSDLYNGGRNPC